MAEDVLFTTPSPNGNAEAVVEDDGRVVFMYLHFADETGQPMRGVWVRNLKEGPEVVLKEDLQLGQAPMMPVTHITHPKGTAPLKPENCRVIWLPDGSGVGLFEGPELVAAILSEQKVGYARDAVKKNALAQPLPAEVKERFSKAQRYWDSWEDSPLKWEVYRDGIIAEAEKVLGPRRSVAEVSHGEWPPMSVALLESDRAQALVTAGMSQRPLPSIEQMIPDAAQLRRVELGVMFPHGATEALRDRLIAWLTTASAYPWNKYTWFGHGHTIPTDAFGSSWGGVLLADSQRLAPSVTLPATPDGDPAILLWMVPITAMELESSRARGSQTVLDHVTQPRPLDSK